MWQYNNTLSHYGKVGMKWGERGVSKADYKSIKKKAAIDFKNDRNKAHSKELKALATNKQALKDDKKMKGPKFLKRQKVKIDRQNIDYANIRSKMLDKNYVAKASITTGVSSAAAMGLNLSTLYGMPMKQKIAWTAGTAAVAALVAGGGAKVYQKSLEKQGGIKSVRSRIEEGLKKR